MFKRLTRALAACAGSALRYFALAVFTPLLLSCGGGDGEGGQCQSCRSAQPQCDSGLSCRQFRSDLLPYSLCATPSTTSCPVPF